MYIWFFLLLFSFSFFCFAENTSNYECTILEKVDVFYIKPINGSSKNPKSFQGCFFDESQTYESITASDTQSNRRNSDKNQSQLQFSQSTVNKNKYPSYFMVCGEKSCRDEVAAKYKKLTPVVKKKKKKKNNATDIDVFTTLMQDNIETVSNRLSHGAYEEKQILNNNKKCYTGFTNVLPAYNNNPNSATGLPKQFKIESFEKTLNVEASVENSECEVEIFYESLEDENFISNMYGEFINEIKTKLCDKIKTPTNQIQTSSSGVEVCDSSQNEPENYRNVSYKGSLTLKFPKTLKLNTPEKFNFFEKNKEYTFSSGNLTLYKDPCTKELDPLAFSGDLTIFNIPFTQINEKEIQTDSTDSNFNKNSLNRFTSESQVICPPSVDRSSRNRRQNRSSNNEKTTPSRGRNN